MYSSTSFTLSSVVKFHHVDGSSLIERKKRKKKAHGVTRLRERERERERRERGEEIRISLTLTFIVVNPNYGMWLDQPLVI